MAKVQTKNVAAKLRNKNIFFLFGFFFFGGGAYILLPYYFAAGVLCVVAAGVCVAVNHSDNTLFTINTTRGRFARYFGRVQKHSFCSDKCR